MIIRRIRAKNYLSIEKLDLEIGRGVFFIQGNNLDDSCSSSNGAGKSVFCSTISWVLFDDFARPGMKKDDVIGPFDEFTRVQIEIELKADDILVVERFRNHPKLGNGSRIKRNGENITQHTNKQNDQLIEHILGISKQVFFRSVYFQEDNKSILNATPAELMRVIGEIIGLESIDELISEAKKSHKSYSLTTESLRVQGTAASKALDATRGRINTLESNLRDFDETKRRERELLIFSINELRQKIEVLESKIERFNNHYGSVKECLGAKRKWLEANSVLLSRRSNLDRLIRLKKQHEMLIEAKNESAKKYREDHSNIVHNTTGTCSHCGQVMVNSEFTVARASELATHVSKIDAEIAGEQLALISVEERLEAAKEDVENAEKILSELPGEAEVSKRESHAELFNAWTREKDKYNIEYKAAVASLESFDASKKTSYDMFSNMLSVAKEEEQEHIEDLTAKRNSFKEARDRMLAVKKFIAVLKDYKMASINQFIYNLVDHINQNLEIITNGDMSCDVDINEKTDSIQLRFTSSAKKDLYPYTVFSTGEKTRIRKAVEASLNSILGINFMVDDEGMKGCDDNGVSSIMEFMSNHRGLGTVLVVSHHPNAFNEKMGKVITVSKKNGATSAKVQ